VYRLYVEFNEVRASAKVESALYEEPDRDSKQVAQLAEGDAAQFLRWKVIPKEGLTPEQKWVYVATEDGRAGWALDKQFGVQVYKPVGESQVYTIEVPRDVEPVPRDPIEAPTDGLLQVDTSMPTVCGPVVAGSWVRLWSRFNLGQTIVRAWTAKGVMLTVRATLLGFALALVLGLVAGLMLVSNNPILLAISKLYVEVVRGIPLLVIVLYVGFVVTPYLREATDGKLDLRGFPGAVIGLGFGYGAYLAEVFRAGIQSIHRGQMEAARSLGMSYFQAMRHVILPQAFRVVLPPLGNDFIAMLKDSSLISVVALAEILQQGRLWVSRTFRAFEGYNTVALMYLVMTLLLSLFVRFVERRTALPGRSEG
jgi:polar amino acid transport system permease protein